MVSVETIHRVPFSVWMVHDSVSGTQFDTF